MLRGDTGVLCCGFPGAGEVYEEERISWAEYEVVEILKRNHASNVSTAHLDIG